MKLRSLVPIALLAMSACGGIASIDIFFVNQAPVRDGSGNIAIKVTEGLGTAQVVLEEHVEPFDEDFDVAKIRLPFGTGRTVIATIETDEAQPFTVFGGRTQAFPLEASDSPNLFIDMFPVPAPGSARVVGATSGRVSSSTVSLSITLVDTFGGLGLSLSEDPLFPAGRTVSFGAADPRVMVTSVMPLTVRVDFPIDGRCTDRAGCTRTIYLKNVDASGFESDVYSTSFIYDPLPPRLIDVTVRIDEGSVLGTDGTASIEAELDEPAVVDAFASLSGGSSSCAAQSVAVDGVLTGLDFARNCVGTYSIELSATDLAGNNVRFFEVATLAVDRLPPAPIDLTVVTSSCVMQHAVVVGGPGAAEPRGIVDADGTRARAGADGAFAVTAEPGAVELLQVDAAGNESASQTVEVMSCGS